ncbi:MAG: aldehyde dehydrogenase family protein [Actinomycetia bacterium]|nr:aldehyde dehydrogenase family protein [Actinomycetes bacterium]
MTETFRVTYATLSADNDDLHAAYDEGIERARAMLGGLRPFVIGGEMREGIAGAALDERSPADHDLRVANLATASAEDVADAVAAAHVHAPTWAATPWQDRAEVLDRAADLISERRFELSAVMAMEVGKNRLEALGDVEETADLIRYYGHQMREHQGFAQPMERLSPEEATFDVMRPYGVWAVVAPFNFPMALAIAPTAAALIVGNTVVLKPSEQGALTSILGCEALWDAGIPPGALHVVTGPGETVGRALVQDPRVGGITFTGSYDVGMALYRARAGAWPKPVVCEMGGKNPVIVGEAADLDLAVEGTARSAFGYSGQKCSAASRCYVERSVYGEFVDRLVERADAVVVGDPLRRDVFMGPVIDAAAVSRYESAVAEASQTGRVLAGGRRIDDGALERGYFVAPTVVEAPIDGRLFSDELFVPFVAVAPVSSLDDAIDRANASPLGLTAGLFSREQADIDRFLERIDAGVVYVNRKSGATTGAWPGVQPFGGWKGSGTNGKAGGGPYYLQQYAREQSRTIVS